VVKPKIYGAAARRRIDRTVQRDEARTDGSEPAGLPIGGGMLPRTYRRFTLTEQLDAGSSAAVEWDDGTTGTVVDNDTRCWGLEGETGEAAAVATDDGDVEWRVTGNPGQPIYSGSLDDDTTSSPTDVVVSIEGNSRTVECELRKLPASGMKYASGTDCFVGHSRGDWYIVAMLGCTVDA
jgi:hypothetical protein